MIAVWLLIFFAIGPMVRAYERFQNALKMNQSISDILWQLVWLIIVVASGIFLLRHIIRSLNELRYMEREMEQKRSTLEYYRSKAKLKDNENT